MKLKTLFFVAGATLLMSSCVKSRTCTCTTTYSDGSPSSTSSSPITGVAGVNSSKKNQTSECQSQGYSDSYSTTTCALAK